MGLSKYPRGSEWHKWDLHVHTPASHSHTECGSADWSSRFVSALNAADVDAVAITDYFLLDGYKAILQAQTKLTKVVFPGVELRLADSVLVGRSGDAGAPPATSVNLQLVFDNDPEIFARVEECLRALKFKDYGGEDRAVSRKNLIALGKQIESGAPDAQALKRGCEQAAIPKDLILEELQKRGLRDRTLIILPYDLYGGIDDIDPERDSLIKSHLTKLADIIETGNERQREFFLGKREKLPYRLSDGSENPEFLKFIGRPKPCVRGSDAKSLEAIGQLPTGRYCWIKADPTFEGLRQILYEPDERVRLQPTNPQKFDRSRVMTSAIISGSNGWFQDDREVPLNEGLVGVIGGKGTGKTALLDLIALATGSYEEKPDSFLKSARELLKGCSVKVQWGDGEVQTATVGALPAAEARTRYLSQGFVREKCDPGNTAQLQEQIESVIYQNLPDVDSAAFADFESLKNARLSVVSDAKDRLTAELLAANETVAVASMGTRALPQMRKAIVDTEKAIAKLDDERTAAVQSVGKEEETKRLLGDLKELTETKSTAVQKVSGMQASLTKADRVLADLKVFRRDGEMFVARVRETLDELEVDRATVAALRFTLDPKNLEEVVTTKKTVIQSAIDKGRADVEKLDQKIAEANKKLGANKSIRTKLEDINRHLSSLKNQLRSQNEQETQTKAAAADLPAQIERRRELYCGYFDLLRQEKAELQRIYAPIEGKLKENDSDTSVFSFSVQFTADANSMAEYGHGLVDHTVNGPLRQRSVETLRQFIKGKLPTPNLDGETLSAGDKKAVLDFVDAVENYFRTDPNGDPLSVAAQMRSGTENDFYSWLFCPDCYNVTYSIRFRGTELEKLSPGLKGAALLILYLELDAKDQRPILIDQPEENLDNRTVYETLRGYFRAAKSRRQVLVVTHNPNLVVNTDAEQTIVANFCKDTKIQPTTICYVSGALENTFTDSGADHPLEKQGIRDHICQVLEGGREAFEKREKKYGFS